MACPVLPPRLTDWTVPNTGSTLLVSFKLTTIPIAEFNSSRKIKCMPRTVGKVGEYRTSLPALNKAGLQFHPFWMLERTLRESKWLSEGKREWQRDKRGWEYNSNAVSKEREGLPKSPDCSVTSYYGIAHSRIL